MKNTEEKYYIYHNPAHIWKGKKHAGKIGKIGCTDNPKRRNKQQPGEYIILEEHTCIYLASDREIELQKEYDYPVDNIPYWQTYKNVKNRNNDWIDKVDYAAKVKNTDYAAFQDRKVANTDWEAKVKNTDWEAKVKNTDYAAKVKNTDYKAIGIKISQANKGISRNKGILRSQKFKESKHKPIDQLTKDGTFIKTWPSIKEASETLDINRNTLTGCLTGRLKLAGGFKWEKYTIIIT